jgi:uncharacterized membrane protein YdjX (TVP38/TMEM64 family)
MPHISFGTHPHNPPHMLPLLMLTVLAACIAALWKWTPAAHYLSPEMIAGVLQDIRHSDWAVPAIIGIYIVGTMVFFPLTILIIATALVFPPLEASGVALVGALSSACLGYTIGRLSGVNPMSFLKGRGGEKIRHYTKHSGVLGVAIVRLLPLLPLGIVDVGLGMAHIPFSTYLIATLLGLMPGIVALSLLGDSLGGLWRSHDMRALLYVALGVLCWVGIILISHFIVRHWHGKNEAVSVNG